MSSRSRPGGSRCPPRRGASLQTNRNIRIHGVRRAQIDTHNLGRALLRLAQERYEARPTESTDSE